MKKTDNIIKEADNWARKEIEKYGYPPLALYEIANKKGQELAEKNGADKEIALLGTILMDIKLGEAKEKGLLKEHAKYCAKATREFLKDKEISEEIKEKIINCAEAHHKQVPFKCKEAEVVMNADCYKFLDLNGMFNWLTTNEDFKIILKIAEKKLEEKWNDLTFDDCKEELKEDYELLKILIKKLKENTK